MQSDLMKPLNGLYYSNQGFAPVVEPLRQLLRSLQSGYWIWAVNRRLHHFLVSGPVEQVRGPYDPTMDEP